MKKEKINNLKLVNKIPKRNIKKYNAFTLIELLAIIVILAIIAVITVPIILNVIDNAKKTAAKDSVHGYKDAINKYYITKLSEDSNFKLDGTYIIDNGNLGEFEIPIEGTKPTSGRLNYENNIIKDGCIIIDNYKIIIENEKIKSVEKGLCPMSEILEDRNYNVGETITYGGYQWYVINDDGKNVTLFMNNNQLKNMAHCPGGLAGNDCPIKGSDYVYSWKDSAIQKYLNGTFYNELNKKIGNTIIPVEICNEPSGNEEAPDAPNPYGGYLKTEIEENNFSCGAHGYSTYNIRLLSSIEYERLLKKDEYKDIINKRNSSSWWLMQNTLGEGDYYQSYAHGISVGDKYNEIIHIDLETNQEREIRPVITVKK